MDPQGTISQRVYRDGTRYIDGKYVKDLSALNRPLQQTVIIDDNADCISMQVGYRTTWMLLFNNYCCSEFGLRLLFLRPGDLLSL